MKDVIVILTDINASCDTAHLFMSNNCLRAKTGRTIDEELTKSAVASAVMKGRRKEEEEGMKR